MFVKKRGEELEKPKNKLLKELKKDMGTPSFCEEDASDLK